MPPCGPTVIHMDETLNRAVAHRHQEAERVGRTIADRVAAEITRRGHYKSTVAQAADISQATFSRKINGKTDFTIPELVRVADALGTDWTQFLPDPAPEVLSA